MGIVADLKDEFLINNPDYTNDVNNFIDYVSAHDGKEFFDKEFTIGGMTTIYILDSLQYNIANEKIKSKETAKKYLTSIGMLVDYILLKSSIKNISLKNELGAPSRWEDSSYRSQCNRFVENCVQLRDKEIFSAIEFDMAEQLVEWCDIQIRNAIEGENLFGRSALFRKMVAGLCVKLMLLTGVTYRCLRQLKMEALDLDANTITISNFIIRLPINLSKQLKHYAIIREENNIDSEYLFVNAKGKQWKEQTKSSGIPDYLEKDGFEVQLTSIIKYGIKELINIGINEAIIMDITWASSDIIKDCLPANEMECGWYSYINSKIVNAKLYERL